MIDLKTIIIILVLHFIADFVLQTNWMAVNKSKNNLALFVHVAVYSAVFCFVGLIYAVINGILHFIVDFITSRITSKLWKEQNYRLFFTVIGLDQTLHFVCLFSTYILIN